MKHQEKKYRVDNFTDVLKKLNDLDAKENKRSISKHYYTHSDGNDVIKLVEYSDRIEIHKLK